MKQRNKPGSQKQPKYRRAIKPICFQPVLGMSDVLEHIRRKRGDKFTTGLVNEALVVHFEGDIPAKLRTPEIEKCLADYQAKRRN